jgi:hypothetical protein
MKTNVATIHVNAENAVSRLATLQSGEAERIKRELEDLRAGLMAWSEQALERFRSAGLVPLDAVTGVIQELAAITSAERQRAAHLEESVRSLKAELDVERQSAARDQEQATVHLERQLHASREALETATAAAAKARAELKDVRNRSQQIIDEQGLQLMEFKRELDQVAVEVRRARAGMDAMQQRDAVRPIERLKSPVDIDRRSLRAADTLQFDSIEAALADSPPVPQWPRVAV